MKILPKYLSTHIVYEYNSRTIQMDYEMERNYWIRGTISQTTNWKDYDSYITFDVEGAKIYLLFNKKDIMHV